MRKRNEACYRYCKTVYFSDESISIMEAIAEEEGLCRSEFIRKAIRFYADKKRPKAKSVA
jgi:metal-responsive CopG/Arc/MetJ family transcriptional regulator